MHALVARARERDASCDDARDRDDRPAEAEDGPSTGDHGRSDPADHEHERATPSRRRQRPCGARSDLGPHASSRARQSRRRGRAFFLEMRQVAPPMTASRTRVERTTPRGGDARSSGGRTSANRRSSTCSSVSRSRSRRPAETTRTQSSASTRRASRRTEIAFVDTPGMARSEERARPLARRGREGRLATPTSCCSWTDRVPRTGAGEMHAEPTRRSSTPRRDRAAGGRRDQQGRPISPRKRLLPVPLIVGTSRASGVDAVVPISATRDDLARCSRSCTAHAPRGRARAGTTTSSPIARRASSRRSSCARRSSRTTRDEVPHAVAVIIDEFSEEAPDSCASRRRSSSRRTRRGRS